MGIAYLSTAGTQGTIRRQSHGVEIAGVTNVVGLQLAVGQVPDLDVLVPAAGHDDGVGGVGGEPHAGDPVTVTLVSDGVLALGQGVPQLDGLVPASRHDLPVVGAKGHAQHVLGVVLEPPGGLAAGQVPQSQVLVPGARQSKVTVRGQHNIGDKVTENGQMN